MEWLFRRHFWIVHLTFLALAAIILACGVNVFLEYWLPQKLVVPEKKVIAKPLLQKNERRNFALANERNLFEAKREVIASADVDFSAIPTMGCINWQDSSPTTLRARLVGTAVFADPRYSLALIEDTRQSQGMVLSYSINDCPGDRTLDPELLDILGRGALKSNVACSRLLDSATIKRIDTDRVYFFNDAERRCEFMAMEGADMTPPPRVSAAPNVPGDDFGKSIRKTGPSSYDIDSSDLENALNNLSLLSTQARMVPAFEDGKPVGFKFFSIRPNSAFAKLGFENGDVITKINGYELNNADKILEIFQNLRSDSQFTVEGNKGGVGINNRYNVKR